MDIHMAEQETKELKTQEQNTEGAAVNQEAAEDLAPAKKLSPKEMEAAIEAILFTMGDAVEAEQIAKALQITQDEVWTAVKKLSDRYGKAGCGIMIQRFDNAVQLCTKAEQFENLVRIAKVPKKLTLSDSVLETLSIVAYKQPITKAEVEVIRGVNSDYAMNKLVEYDLVKELGRKDAPGKPILYGTTEQFLRTFGVKNLSDLPPMNTVRVADFKAQAEAEVDTQLGV